MSVLLLLWKYKGMIGLALVLALLGAQTLRVSSLKKDIAVYQAAAKAAQARATAINAATASISQAAGKSEQVQRSQIVSQTKTLIERIPTDVPQAAVALIPAGAVRLFDDAAIGRLPSVSDPTGGPDDTTPTVNGARALAVAIDDLGTCRAISTQLTSLQGWVLDEQKAFGK